AAQHLATTTTFNAPSPRTSTSLDERARRAAPQRRQRDLGVRDGHGERGVARPEGRRATPHQLEAHGVAVGELVWICLELEHDSPALVGAPPAPGSVTVFPQPCALSRPAPIL